jgi:TatA/E family protein of Tat protein translocase
MFGTMGFSELIIILAIVLIIFGAGRLPQIGEGVGKALKGFKKEIHDAPQPSTAQTQQETLPLQQSPSPTTASAATQPAQVGTASANVSLKTASDPGPEMTPGTTASMLYGAAAPVTQPTGPVPQRESQTDAMPAQHVPSMEERAATPAPTARAQYPPLPAGSHARPAAKRPSAIVNKDAVARVQAQQAALKAKTQPGQPSLSSDDMQTVGEGIGDVLRTFRQAVADVRDSVDPQMRTIQAEMDAAQKELQQSLEAAKQPSAFQDDLSKPA